jgi:predicted DNA-binding transcriptional regulator YafY
LKLTEEDAQALAAGMKLSGHFLPIFGDSAERVWVQVKQSIADKSLQKKGEMLANATTVALPVSKIDKDIFQKVSSAIFDKQVLKVTQYKNYNGEEKSFHISPWFIFFKHHSWYLWGKAEELENPGPFRISRMRLIQPVSTRRFEVPPENLDMKDIVYQDYLPGKKEQKYSVRLRIFPPFANPAMETEWFPGQQIKWENPKERKIAIYEVETNGLEDISRWIMRALDSFEVLEPQELKEKIQNKIEIYQVRNMNI